MLSRMTRVATDTGAPGEHSLAPADESSSLSLGVWRLEPGEVQSIVDAESDTLLFAAQGGGTVGLNGHAHALPAGTAGLVVVGETATLEAGAEGLSVVSATAGAATDLHAPMGARDVVVPLETAEQAAATGSRSFQLLFGPHNGSTRATMFVGFIPPGKAPWHYHLYDEIVWVVSGTGRVHLPEPETLGPGSVFRLSPREVHIVENASTTEELVVLGVFTPAGSPSAAYLEPGVAAEYRIG
jgi:quercetin dioxygenase-like cupin family protein